ncbi:exodeoxyribonuclease VII large subunit [Actinomarinicola tropica]|uniref:exodeoxyribonuclease VII large subunit n=1 Tax=Actinomarinicola tropica TaxID=2789776 RepID=UPI001897410F|nr:exodeoxyribonuclease VII large subunit [Actinomarinicola tropica]
MDAHTLSVAQLNARISDALSGAFPDQVWVTGEVHGFRGSANGHVYFRLVEPGTLGRPSEASLSVVLFRGNRRVVDHVLARAGGLALSDELEVRIRGEVLFYAPQGRVQLRMTGIDPSHTLGRLAADRDALLRRLAADGLLDRNGRLRLTPVPLRIGLVTSADSAAAADFLHELEQSGVGWSVTLLDTRVQGAGSVEHLVASLTVAAQLPLDVVAVVRGGGSRTDLVAFDHEAVARAIASMPVPVLTGIGHEIDESVADRVAHRAFKTPTACAAFLCEAVGRFRTRCDELGRHLAVRSRHALDRQDAHVHALATRVASGARTTVELGAARLDALGRAVATLPERSLLHAERHADALEREVRALDPARVIARGWTITRTADGQLVRHLADAPIGTALRTTVADGTVSSTVEAGDPHPDPAVDPGGPDDDRP